MIVLLSLIFIGSVPKKNTKVLVKLGMVNEFSLYFIAHCIQYVFVCVCVCVCVDIVAVSLYFCSLHNCGASKSWPH